MPRPTLHGEQPSQPLSSRPLPPRRAAMTIRNHRAAKCPATGKLRYKDRTQAREALQSARWTRDLEINLYGSSARHEVRTYTCPSCLGHHLTSKPSQDATTVASPAPRAVAVDALRAIHEAAISAVRVALVDVQPSGVVS